ncbi:MAG: DUF4062 domain-containing protein [Pseudomonadota bacterium]
MQKIHHVFVSSTYTDLIDVRKKVSEAVAKAGYVAEGMEIFPASSQSQMEFITRVIDRCDYYILIVAGKYGSLAEDGISYTEKEYEYAVSNGIPVLSLINQSPESLPKDKTETDQELQAKLTKFSSRVASEAVVDFWNTPDEAATKALAALSQAVVSHPGVGWTRANAVAGEDLLREINELRKHNEHLEKRIRNFDARVSDVFADLNLASLDENFTIRYVGHSDRYKSSVKISLSWGDILRVIGPNFRTYSTAYAAQTALGSYIQTDVDTKWNNIAINSRDAESILMHLEVIGFLEAKELQSKGGGQHVYHRLTRAGMVEMLRRNAVKAEIPDKESTDN